ncbi:MAG: PEPxxWA-CTERM sorting domain-containing protein [Pseudomonadota bacterium]
MKKYILAAAGVMVMAAPAGAATIISATSATVDVGGPGFGSINDTFNQAGLNTGYTSGVTDFDTYIASAPTHSFIFAGNEWFANEGSSAQVTYDLGGVVGIDRLALWNDEAGGIGSLNLSASTDGVNFSSLGIFAPTDNPQSTDYLADIFSFSATDARFVRFEMSNCPQADNIFNACAIGEVAFRSAVVNAAVPEPATWAFMILGFGAIGGAMRRQRKANVKVSYA